MAKYMRARDPKMIEIGYDFYAQVLTPKPYPNIEGIKLALEDMAERNPKAREAKPEQFFDARFVRELDGSGFIDSLYR